MKYAIDLFFWGLLILGLFGLVVLGISYILSIGNPVSITLAVLVSFWFAHSYIKKGG